jgi:hypothetical protein
MTTTIHLSGPADVLAVLPYQLGFHPSDSLVAVSLHGSRMGLVQRIDLPPPEHVGDAVTAMIAPLRRDRPKAVLLIGFEDREGASRQVLDEMANACRAEGILVADRMIVRNGRWFAPDCRRSCCPARGLLLPAPGEVPAVAEFVGREICPLPDRSALADRLEPSQSALFSRAVSVLAEEWVQLRPEIVHAGGDSAHDRCLAEELKVWSRVLCGQDDAEPIRALSSHDLAKLAGSLTDVDLRDGLIAWLCPETLPPGLIDARVWAQMSAVLPQMMWLDQDIQDTQHVISLQRIEERLCQLCAALPDPWAVSALTVLASFAWWRGDGALTRIALDRALRTDPQYRLALLLERMVDLAIRPQQASA